MFKPDYLNQFKKTFKVGEKEIKITIGKFAEQASSAVLIECGGTSVLTTVVMGRESTLPYFPLQVEFNEKLYAGGIIKGSRWVKRDFRSSEGAVLTSRVIDRSIRPLFPEGLKNEVQVLNNVFSFDKENEADMLGLLATGIGLTISKIPFFGPLAGLRLGYSKTDKKFIFNPTVSERKISDLDLIVSGGKDSIVMVEAGANEVEEDIMIEALGLAQKEISQVCQIIEEIKAEIGQEKVEFTKDEMDAQKYETIKKYLSEKLDVVDLIKKEAVFEEINWAEIYDSALEILTAEDETIAKDDLKAVMGDLIKETVRSQILNEGMRPDGRKTEEIRPIHCEVDIFDRNHGSAMFKRGATQVATIVTLGSPSLGQFIEDMGGEEVRHYMHHYNMPPFASGETGRVGYPKRREIGHGALGERALLPVIPSQEDFPYTIHVVSEILSSNGSTSQASICGSTLSLMSAGVPIKRPVAGIAMGLITDGQGTYKVLSDIKDVEDHFGDMDFKVAGTEYGITALQMDIKVKGISLEVLKIALAQAKEGRLFILGKMLEVIDQPKKELSEFAPKIHRLNIPVEKIGELIGPGGKVIKSIIELSGAEVSVDEDPDEKIGVVCVSSSDQAEIDHAIKLIEGYVKELNVNDEFDGEVTRVENYGIFVKLVANKEGLLHISSMSKDYVRDASDLYKVGDQVHVRISEIQDDGKIKLSMLSQSDEKAKQSNNKPRRYNKRDSYNRKDSRRQGMTRFKKY